MNKKKVKKKQLRRIIISIIILLVTIWLNNTSLLVANQNKQPKLLAHRGLGQTFDLEGVKWNTNTAGNRRGRVLGCGAAIDYFH